jgi:hypothetical protein
VSACRYKHIRDSCAILFGLQFDRKGSPEASNRDYRALLLQGVEK